MKKLLAVILTICMMASMLCVPALAADPTDELPKPAEGTLLRITAMKGDGIVLVGDYTNFKDGWNVAMDLAGDLKKMKQNDYDRVVVDIYTDWKADRKGQFTDEYWGEAGFDYYAVSVPEDAKVTLNLNGHAIDRGLDVCHENGEVMYIRDDADIIINNGTIKGGWSHTGAGGIHILDDANVTLNNVHIVGNTTDDDDGGGIAMYDGASLVMNGGSFEKNIVRGTWDCYGGAIYIEESSAIFNNVAFKNNVAKDDNHYGAAIYADRSTVVLNECTVDGNGIEDKDNKYVTAFSVIHAVGSSITINNTSLTNNGGLYYEGASYNRTVSTLIYLKTSTLVMDQCGVSKNTLGHLIQATTNSAFFVSSTNMTQNIASVLKSTSHSAESYFIGCTFGNNNTSDYLADKYSFLKYSFEVDSIVTFYDCDLGNSNFDKNDAGYIKLECSAAPENEAVIRVSAFLADGTTSFTQYYKEHAYGWNLAMEATKTNSYDHIVVDLLADWNTSINEFGALIIPENARVTLNMNGHTIDRATVSTLNGEVLYISANADVIINDGTITGGCSNGGAGGIHIKDNARVTLNDVNVVGNTSVGSNGAAIAVYDGAILVMNGGSISDSVLSTIDFLFTLVDIYPYGTLYVEDATATLKGVTINGNRSTDSNIEGVAIYADNSTVTLNDCVVSNNGISGVRYGYSEPYDYAESIIGGEDSTFVITNTNFTGNGSISSTSDIDYSHLFYLEDSSLTIDSGKITGNKADKLFYFDDSKADLKGVTITDNESVAFDVDNSSAKVTLTECVLGNNSPVKSEYDVLVDTKGMLVLDNCDLGDTTYEKKSMVTFSNKAVGSIFGEGSLTVIVSILALISSGVAIFFMVDMKKKLVPASAKASAATEDEDEE